MSKSEDNPNHAHRRERLVRPGILALARMVAGILDSAEPESPMLFEQLAVACG
jgi:hypothetical protein